MITFSKSSWVYKFNNFINDEVSGSVNANGSKSLCPYFWLTLWNVFISLVWAVLCFLVSSVLGDSVLEKVFSIDVGISDLYWSWLVGILTIVLVFGFVVLFAVILYLTGEIFKYSKHKVSTFKGKNTKDNTSCKPNLLLEWLRAKKEKVCPMIEFKEED